MPTDFKPVQLRWSVIAASLRESSRARPPSGRIGLVPGERLERVARRGDLSAAGFSDPLP